MLQLNERYVVDEHHGSFEERESLVAGAATPRVGRRESAQITLVGAAATRLLPTAGAGGAATTLWSLRRAGLRATPRLPRNPPRPAHRWDLRWADAPDGTPLHVARTGRTDRSTSC